MTLKFCPAILWEIFMYREIFYMSVKSKEKIIVKVLFLENAPRTTPISIMFAEPPTHQGARG